MSLVVPFGLLLCAALWLKGLSSFWARAFLLAAFLGLLFVLLPSVTQDRSLANLAIYQQEARAFAARVITHIERGDTEAAKRQLLYFSKSQDWSTANDPDALRNFYKGAEFAGQSEAASAAQSIASPASK